MELAPLSYHAQSARRLFLAGFLLLPRIASAHPGHFHPGEEDEFDALTSGILHPFSGLDHLIVTVAVGWFVFSQLGIRKAIIAGSFLGSLAIGIIAGRGMQAFSGVEIAISLTLMALGIFVLRGKLPSQGLLVAGISAGGLIHGLAQGCAASTQFSILSHGVGILAGSALLLGVGGVISNVKFEGRRSLVPRLAGTVLLVFASVLFVQAI